MRVGHGFDVHRLVPDRKLILGGVTIPFDKGLLGHSDADVLTHAIGDALLGAAALGDLGAHFPDTDEKYAGISSLSILEDITRLLREHGWTIHNIDATVVMQRPKLAPHIHAMRENLARATNLDIDQVSIKATTTEGLGYTGDGTGAAAYAVVLIEEAS